jgi:hypothetical protein
LQGICPPGQVQAPPTQVFGLVQAGVLPQRQVPLLQVSVVPVQAAAVPHLQFPEVQVSALGPQAGLEPHLQVPPGLGHLSVRPVQSVLVQQVSGLMQIAVPAAMQPCWPVGQQTLLLHGPEGQSDGVRQPQAHPFTPASPAIEHGRPL